jgi:hypothetical protein
VILRVQLSLWSQSGDGSRHCPRNTKHQQSKAKLRCPALFTCSIVQYSIVRPLRLHGANSFHALYHSFETQPVVSVPGFGSFQLFQARDGQMRCTGGKSPGSLFCSLPALSDVGRRNLHTIRSSCQLPLEQFRSEEVFRGPGGSALLVSCLVALSRVRGMWLMWLPTKSFCLLGTAGVSFDI